MLRRSFVGSLFLVGVTAGAEIPRPSPEFAIHMTPSGQALLSQYRGKVVVLALLSTT